MPIQTPKQNNRNPTKPTRHLTMMDNCMSWDSWLGSSKAATVCCLYQSAFSFTLGVEGGGRKQQDQTLPGRIPPSIRLMTKLSLLEYSQIAILHLALLDSYTQEGCGVILWQPKGSEEL